MEESSQIVVKVNEVTNSESNCKSLGVIDSGNTTVVRLLSHYSEPIRYISNTDDLILEPVTWMSTVHLSHTTMLLMYPLITKLIFIYLTCFRFSK